MFFKNLQIFTLPKGYTLSISQLEEALARRPLQPCQGATLVSRGWEEPYKGMGLVLGQGQNLLIRLGVEQKSIPGAAVKRETGIRAEKLEKERGFKPGRKLMREIKEQVLLDFLPRAFVTYSSTYAWIDLANARVVVDSSSAARAEDLISCLRDALGEFPAGLPRADQSPAAIMTSWMHGQGVTLPPTLVIEDECELRGKDASKPTVRYLRHELEGQNALSQHISEGKEVTRLALCWREKISLVVNEKAEFKRIKFVAITEDADRSESAEEDFANDFVLMTGELSRMIEDLNEVYAIKAED